jgi:hypothetical protein
MNPMIGTCARFKDVLFAVSFVNAPAGTLTISMALIIKYHISAGG